MRRWVHSIARHAALYTKVNCKFHVSDTNDIEAMAVRRVPSRLTINQRRQIAVIYVG